MPDVLLSLLALWFAAATGWFPVGGAQSPLHDLMSPMQQFWDRAHHLILPALVLAAADLAGIMRQMRSSLLDTLRAEYVTAARARGLGEGWVIYKHALRNAINPLLTIFGYSLAALLSGAFIVENIMAWPGLGRLTMEAFFAKDSYLVVDCVVMATGAAGRRKFCRRPAARVERPAHPVEIKWNEHRCPILNSTEREQVALSPWQLFWRRLETAAHRDGRRRDFDFSLPRRAVRRFCRALQL